MVFTLDGRFAFQANNNETIQKMIEKIGLKTLDDLFNDIPPELKVKNRPERFPAPHSELETFDHLFSILRKNKGASEFLSFLGSGLYNHYIPAGVEEIQNRAEFKTSYTPYAPEMSQGLLTALFEYQSMITELTGLPAANNGLYDWATAIAEAALMCARIKHTKEPLFLMAETVLLDRYETVKTFTNPLDIEVDTFKFNPKTGQTDILNLKEKLNDNVIGVYIENPNLFGIIEDDLKEIIDLVHEAKALVVVGIDPISLGIIEAPGNLDADICVGEGQPLGNAPNFGGPLLGIFTTKDSRQFLRNLPGRVIGYTKTKDGKKDAYVMTLQTREQHIRREKATSNICSNEALFSVGATVYLALIGPGGLIDLGYHVMGRLGYLFDKLQNIPSGLTIPFIKSPHFKEFLLSMPKGQYSNFKNYMLENEILIGPNVGEYITSLESDAVIFSVNEKHSLSDLDHLVKVIQSYLGGN
jgi:glycine dehydrogenase subunit 1